MAYLNVVTTDVRQRATDALERRARNVEASIATTHWLYLAGLCAVFLCGALLQARHQRFWFDEILTEYVSAPPTWSQFWAAQRTTADATPPLFHLITRIDGMVLGWGEGAQRVPEILGYMLMMVCIYCIARRYVSPLLAFTAALLPHLTAAPLYAVDARPYALVLGLTAVALLCWTYACEYRTHRWLLLLLLWFSLAVGVSCHYYFVLSIGAIGAGELVRTLVRRRIDSPVWLAVIFSLAPIPFHLPLFPTLALLKAGNWAPATLHIFAELTADLYIPPAAPVLAGFLFAVIVLAAACAKRQISRDSVGNLPPLHELVAWIALLASPISAFVIGKAATGTFVGRYAIVTVIGFALLMSLVLDYLFRGSRAAACAALLLCMLAFSVRYVVGSRRGDLVSALVPWMHETIPPQDPIVIGSPLTFLELTHYLQNDLRQQIFYTPDPAEAFHYGHNSTPDYNLQGLRGLTDFNLPSYRDFTQTHKHFVLLSEGNGWIWLRLRHDGAQLMLLNARNGYSLFDVSLAGSK